MNEFIKEIKSTLKDCKNSIKDYELSNEGGGYINQGWIEALEYVINTYNLYNKGSKKMNKHKLISDFIDFVIKEQSDDKEQKEIMLDIMDKFLN